LFEKGIPCDEDGYDLELGALPPPPTNHHDDSFFPFTSFAKFELAKWAMYYVYLLGTEIQQFARIWSAFHPGTESPFKNICKLRAKVNSIKQGSIGWSLFKIQYKGLIDKSLAEWKKKEYKVWYRDPLIVAEQQILNKEFANEIDWAPKRIFDTNGHCCQEHTVSCPPKQKRDVSVPSSSQFTGSNW
jgi:hypothetical protein